MAAILGATKYVRVINRAVVTTTVSTVGAHISPINMNDLYNYYTIIIIVIGIIGNIISIRVLRKQEHGGNKTSHTLMMISFFNSLYLLSLIPNLLRATNVIEPVRKWNCGSDTYFSLLASSTTTLEILYYAFEILFVEVYPQYSHKIDTLKHVYGNIVLVPILASIITTAISVQDIHMPHNCKKNDTYLDVPLFYSVNAVSALTIILGAVVVLGIWIIIGKHWLKHNPAPLPNRRRYSAQECEDVWNTYHTIAIQNRSHDGWTTYTEINKIMSTVSKTFVILSLPVCIVSFFFDLNQSDVPGRWLALQRLTMMLFNTNFGINFFLYCLSGQNFRQELVKCIFGSRGAERQPRIVRHDTPRIPRHHVISNDSLATYHSSSGEAGQNLTVSPLGPPTNTIEDFNSVLPPSTPRHEIMEWVELGLSTYASQPQIYAGYVIRTYQTE